MAFQPDMFGLGGCNAEVTLLWGLQPALYGVNECQEDYGT